MQKEEKLRIRGYKPENALDLVQMDSISIFKDGIKRYKKVQWILRQDFPLAIHINP